MTKLDLFISGETLDLCVPTKDFAYNSDWFSWFNDSKITKFLEQGVYPNTREMQEQFLVYDPNRLILIIVNKYGLSIGVISLSFINYEKQCCDVALVVSDKGETMLKPFLSLEAMALITSHAFEKMGMQRVNFGQHIKLKRFQNRLELLGYKLEGLHPKKFKKGTDIADTMSACISFEDYITLKTLRGGSLWDNLKLMKQRIKKLPKKSYCDYLMEVYEGYRKKYYDKIFES